MIAQAIEFVPNLSSQTNIQVSSLSPRVATALICHNSLLRSGLAHILQGTSFVVAQAGAGPGLFQEFSPEPALIIAEANQDIHGVLETIRQMSERFPEARIVVLADQFDISFVRQGQQAGVDGFCLAVSTPEVLIASLELVMLGESVVPSEVLRLMLCEMALNLEQQFQTATKTASSLSALKDSRLSVREAEILDCLREGAPNKVIARKLDIAEATVKVHVKALLRKIGAGNRTQAAMWATAHLQTKEGDPLNV